MNIEEFRKICEEEKADLHVHTKYSEDSFLSPKKVVAFAKRYKKIIAITDHNEIKGALEAKKYDHGSRIIVGEEIEITDIGSEVLAYGIKEKIVPGKLLDVIGEIKRQGGIAILSHPFRRGYIFRKKIKVISQEILEKTDGVEVLNGRNSKRENQKALELAEKFRKIKTRGSDAHMLWELYFPNNNSMILNFLKNFLTLITKLLKALR